MSKHITLQPRKFSVEFRDWQEASVHGGQLAVAALLEEFGLKARVEQEPALDPRTHRGKGFEPLVYVTQLLHSFTSGGVSLADAERLNEDAPLKAMLGVEKLPDQTAVGEWLRDIGEPGWQALRRINRDLVQWALGRAKPAGYRHLGRTEGFFDDTQIEVGGPSFEGAALNYEGRLALSWQVLLVGPFLADHILRLSQNSITPGGRLASKEGMAQPIAPDYGQQFLFPPALEDWVPADHPARFLREFVDQLDLGALGFALPTAVEGRPPYAPSLLLKIWLYGYFHRLRSTRKLEMACREHLSLLWLTGLIQPDHNSLWRFWRDHQKALRGIFKQTVQLAVRTGAVGLALQAVDGTKIEAAASSRTGWSKERMEKLLVQLAAAVDQIELQVVEENADVETAPGYRLPAGLAKRQALREQIQQGLAQLAADGRQHYHPVEPDARRMKVGDTNRFAYNAQAVVDAQAGVLVACEVTRQENDQGQLVPMVEQAQENVGVAAAHPLTVADTGYGEGAGLQTAAERGWAVLVPPFEGSTAKDNPYATRHFFYHPVTRRVTCPQGQTLDYEGHTTEAGQRIERYRCNHHDCPVRAQCTRDPKGRRVEVRPHTAAVQAMRERLRQPEAQAQLARRREIVEPRFGHLKQQDGFRRWTVWGLAGVQTQGALLCAILNLRGLYRRWRTGRGPEPTSGAAGLNLEGSRFVFPSLGARFRQIGRWREKLLALATAWCRTRQSGAVIAFASPC